MEIESIGAHESYNIAVEEQEALSQIIQTLNLLFSTDFTNEDTLCIRELEERIASSTAIENSILVNTQENARLTFDEVVNTLLQDMIEGHFKFYKQVNDNPAFANMLYDWLFSRYVRVERPQ